GGDHERQAKTGMFKFEWKAAGKELFTSNMLVGAGVKTYDVAKAGKSGGLAGIGAELGYNSKMKGGTFYTPMEQLLAEASRELGDSPNAKRLQIVARDVNGASAWQLDKLADRVAKDVKPGTKAAEAVLAMKAEAESKL